MASFEALGPPGVAAAARLARSARSRFRRDDFSLDVFGVFSVGTLGVFTSLFDPALVAPPEVSMRGFGRSAAAASAARPPEDIFSKKKLKRVRSRNADSGVDVSRCHATIYYRFRVSHRGNPSNSVREEFQRHLQGKVQLHGIAQRPALLFGRTIKYCVTYRAEVFNFSLSRPLSYKTPVFPTDSTLQYHKSNAVAYKCLPKSKT